MYKGRLALTLSVLLLVSEWSFSQKSQYKPVLNKAESILSVRNEVIVRFKKPVFISLEQLSSSLSIDGIKNDTVTAYVNKEGLQQLLKWQIDFTIAEPPSVNIQFGGRNTEALISRYPTYMEYLERMAGFAAQFPYICKLTEFGTSENDRKLLALKISDHPGDDEPEPVVFLTSGIHGDEPLGNVLLLQLIDTLLTSYNQNPNIKRIIDQTEIWINPYSNPDGTYFQSDTTIVGATRFNKNGVDLNRNFPDIRFDNHTITGRQKETQAMMQFMETIRPALSANFHTGSEVVNYPWDTWPRNHPDSLWFFSISRKYADTVHNYSKDNYMTFLDNGITKGYDWYPIFGGRQDYMTCMGGREVTIELSDTKIPPESSIDQYWDYNKNSLLHFMANALTGVWGVIKDSVTGETLSATMMVEDHDTDQSLVISNESDGFYCRLLNSGSWHFTVSAPGYKSTTFTADLQEGLPVIRNMSLIPEKSGELYPDPFHNILYFNVPSTGSKLDVRFYDQAGRMVYGLSLPVKHTGKQEIPVPNFSKGLYIIRITLSGKTWNFKAIKI